MPTAALSVMPAHIKAYPKPGLALGFDSILDAFDTSSGVHLHSSPQYVAGSRYFCGSFYGHPCPTSGKNYATANAFGGPSRPATLVSTQQGVETLLRNDSTRFRKACIFTTLCSVKTHALSLLGTTRLRATSEACHFLQGESPCLEFKGMNS